jgi:hypothetical protein
MVREACAAYLRRTASLAPGVDHLAPRRVDGAEDRRSGYEGLRPIGMRRVKTHELGPRGEAGKSRPSVTRHPASAGPVARTGVGMPQPHSDHRTGPEERLRRGRDVAHLRTHPRAYSGEQLHGVPAALLAWAG